MFSRVRAHARIGAPAHAHWNGHRGGPAAPRGGGGSTGKAPRPPGTVLLFCAALLLLGLAAAQGYVSWRAQYGFIYAAKGQQLPSALEALGLDTGAVIFALLGLAHARMGRPARIERTLNIACALGSMTMNLLSADLNSPRSVAVYVLPAVLYAACSDRLIATAAHAAGVRETSLWRFAGLGLLYGLRALVAFPSTWKGLRLRLLEATPLPVATPEDTPAATPEVRQETRQNPASDRAKANAKARQLLIANPGIPLAVVAEKSGVSERTASRIKSGLPVPLSRELMNARSPGATRGAGTTRASTAVSRPPATARARQRTAALGMAADADRLPARAAR